MNRLLRESAAHVFVESLQDPQLSADDEHHLTRVLRIRPADAITVSDGDGRWAPARLDAGRLLLDGGVVEEPAVSAGERRSVLCAIPKGDRPELIVQKLTELGLDEIAFMTTERSVVRLDDRRAATQLGRLHRVAREAAMQSRRVRLPQVEVTWWSEVLARPGLALAEPDSPPLDATVRAIAIGPEGGFTESELEQCRDHVALSSQVLRVETAAIVAGVLLMRSQNRADR